jgi:hypothetical protein
MIDLCMTRVFCRKCFQKFVSIITGSRTNIKVVVADKHDKAAVVSVVADLDDVARLH